MFKIESYVTPILLSYVDKYVRDFKPADAQVSLWGGGVALHNLVLKADVLQQEVSLPFTLVSGRIHELLIQVPWTKIMSEPIVVTIDTIECVLSLHPPASPEEAPPPESPSRKTQVVEAPPGYMQALVRRIVSNIALRVHHLIVKYVQDDIVLSLNIKHLAVDSAGTNWEAAFADIDQNEPVIRRLVRLDDLTLCLDRADSDGKIRFYQEPLLYRCQLDLRVLTRLVSANTRRASSLSVQLRSSKLAFGVASEQLTLLLRLLRERPQVEVKTPPPTTKVSGSNLTTPLHTTSSNSAEPVRSESWSDWAWSWLPAWMDKEGGIEDSTSPPTPTPVFFTAYLDHVSLVFKIMEFEGGSRKRARGVLELHATNAAVKSSVCSPTMLRFRFGARTLVLQSHGKCVCGHININTANEEPTIYLSRTHTADIDGPWKWPVENFESKIDLAEAIDEEYRGTPNRGECIDSQRSNTSTQGEEARPLDDAFWQMLAPVLSVEYSHDRTPPDSVANPYDSSPIDFQYSDWVEENSIKIKLEPLDISIRTGLIHRLSVIQSIFQELPPIPIPDIPMRTLTVEECESLLDNLPQRRISLDARGIHIRMHPWDHSLMERPSLSPVELEIEVPQTIVNVTGPLYPYRVCSAACQLPHDEGPLWQGARLHVSGTFTSIVAKICSPNDSQPRPCARVDLRFVLHHLLHPELFIRRSIVRRSYSIKINEVNICGSAARLQTAWRIIESLILDRLSPILKFTTIASDALSDEDSVAIDATVEDLTLRGFITSNTNTHIFVIHSARVMALHSPGEGGVKQAWLFSAPDISSTTPYLRLAIQWCTEMFADSLEYVGLWTEPTSVCVDPLLISWLAYKPRVKQIQESSLPALKSSSHYFTRHRMTPPSSSGRGASRTGSGSELIHAARPRSVGSSSEPSERKETKTPAPAKETNFLDPELMVAVHKRMCRMLVNVELGLWVVYVTMTTTSAVDCATVHDSMERHAASSQQVIALSLGRISLSSSVMMKHLWHEIRHDGPTFRSVKPEQTGEEIDLFPWKMHIADVSCYTLEACGVDSTERVSGLRSHLKPGIVNPRTVLDLVTTTVTLSVVTKHMQIHTWTKKPDQQKSSEITTEETRTKYFTTGIDFKPSTLKEFVRGPARRKKPQTAEKETKPSAAKEPTETTSLGPIVSLGVHLHADTPPIIVRLEQDQVHVVASALHCLKHVLTLLLRPPITIPRHGYTSLGGSSHRSLIRSVSELEEQRTPSDDTQSENRSELISIYEPHRAHDAKLKLFFWFQWVVSRATLVVATHQVKLAFDVDDIISTVDVQEHYNQLKVKVASASVRHFIKKTSSNDWTAGVLGGRVIEAREPNNAQEENNFLAVTITQAQISNLPTSWKEELHPKLLQQKSGVDSMWEIYATLAPLEAVLQPSVLENIVSLARDMAPRSFCPLHTEEVESSTTWQWPYCYVTAGGLRLLVPLEQTDSLAEDTFLFQIGRVMVNPHPENPICRRSVNAGHDSGWVSAGGGLEGRQYDVSIKNVALQTTQFKQIIQHESREMEVLKGTGSENPALKWTQPTVSPFVTPVLHAVEITCVIAPAVCAGGSLVCGPAFEFNLVSDCSIELSVDQVNLATRIVAETNKRFASSYDSNVKIDNGNHGMCPYACLLLSSTDINIPQTCSNTTFMEEEISTGAVGHERSYAADSGVDVAMSKSSRINDASASVMKKSVSISLAEEGGQPSDYFELFVTMGTIEVSLYVNDDGCPEIAALRLPRVTTDAQTTETVQLPEEESDNCTSDKSDAKGSIGSRKSLTETTRNADLGHTKLELPIILPMARKCKGNLPLLHLTLHQPNLYFWKRKSQKSLQVSLFNVWLGLGAGPGQGWYEALLSTAKGVPDPVTDIPPALATMKAVIPPSGAQYLSSSSISGKGTVRLDIERPVLFEVCDDRITRLKGIMGLFQRDNRKSEAENSPEKNIDPNENKPFLYRLRKLLIQNMFESITIQVSQVGVSGSEGTVGWDSASLQIVAGIRPERLTARALVTSLLIASGTSADRRNIVMQPLMLGMELDATWEAWRRLEGGVSAREPIVRIGVDFDRVIFDLRPADLAALTRIHHALAAQFDLQESAPMHSNSSESIFHSNVTGQRSYRLAFERRPSGFSQSYSEMEDHYYKDDLKSGAFKLVSGGQLPMAYQVMLHGSTVSWRYPHPRAITRVMAFPLPDLDEEVECVLELYNMQLARWEAHTYFNLPVGEPREIKLYVAPPDAVFAVLWRFRIRNELDEKDKPFEFNINHYMPKTDLPTMNRASEAMSFCEVGDVNAEQLSSALRVDSYFAPRLLPRFRVTMRFTSLEFHAHNSLLDLSSKATSLEGYYVSRPLMRSHRVLSLCFCDTIAHVHFGSPAGILILADTKISSDVLECATGTLEQFVGSTQVRMSASLPDWSEVAESRVRARTAPVRVALHVPRLRTIHALAVDWSNAIENFSNESSSQLSEADEHVPKRVETTLKRVEAHAVAEALEGRVSLWIHNTCASALRVGQEGTDELVPLGPGARLAYRWRSPNAPLKLRFALVSPSAEWHWSNSIGFTVGSTRVRLEDPETVGGVAIPGGGVFLYAKVEVSGGRRTMCLSGRLKLANMLRKPLLYKVRACSVGKTWRSICSDELSAESVGCTVVCGADCDLALKIKFPNQEVGWSGDIPLKECPKENVPWLVKVPNQGDVPYISVWCRVVRARSDGRILAAVWPLYVLYSHLPLDTDVLVVTETELSTTELASAENQTPPLVQSALGRGACTHLMAPGTTAARHKLSFQYRNIECPVTREAIPLHYGVTDTSVFDKQAPVNNIDEVIQEIFMWLERSGTTSAWPYSLVAKHWPGQWQPALLQPKCDVTVRYQAVRAGGGCSLEIQLCPVVLLCNAAPIALTLRAHDAAPLCKLESGAAISAPSAVLQKPFFMSLEMGRETFVSSQLQVWAEDPGRYGAPPKGCVALDHAAHFAIHCNQKVALMTMYYEIKEDINILGVSPTFVVINRLGTPLLASAVAVPSERHKKDIILRPKSFKVILPTKEDSLHGEPMTRFWMSSRWRGGDPSELHTFLCLAVPVGALPAHPPVPVRLGANPIRRALALVDEDMNSIPVVVVQQKHEERWLVTVARDPCPQFVVHNRTRCAIAVGQPTNNTDRTTYGVHQAMSECEGARWRCVVEPGCSVHYSSPAHCARFPPPTAAAPTPNALQFLTFGRVKESDFEPEWCAGVVAAGGEQLLQMPNGETVKLRLHPHHHSTLIELQDVDQNDISASDIRRRLIGPFRSDDSIYSLEEKKKATDLNLERVGAFDKLSVMSKNQSSEHVTFDMKASATDIPAAKQSTFEDNQKTENLTETVEETSLKTKFKDIEFNIHTPPELARTESEKLSFDVIKRNHSQSASTALPSAFTLVSADLRSPDESYTYQECAQGQDWVEKEYWAATERLRCVIGGVTLEMASTADDSPLLALHVDRAAVLLITDNKGTKTTISIADIQVDNLQYESGQYDFAVVATTRAEPLESDPWTPLWNMFAERNAFATRQADARLLLKTRHDWWRTGSDIFHALTEVEMSIGPLALYVEDAYVAAVVQLSRMALAAVALDDTAAAICETRALQCPLRLRTLELHPVDLTLTLHTAVRMYIALDQSPLRLSAFHLQDMMTSAERLTHALTVHYLSAAILGAGWVVGGLELLGAPGALAARVGGATGGVRGVAAAAAAALLRSLSAWAGSLARNLDLLAGDEEHARRAAAARRRPPDSFMAGLAAGITNFAINILGAVGGLAHHPLVGVAVGETESGAAALRRGLLGALTKPLSATADLVAYAGHGLLRQTGWDPVPQPRALTSREDSRLSGGWRRDCVRWTFRLAELSAIAGFDVLLDNAALRLLLTHKYLVVADPETERIVEMIDLRFCTLEPYQGSIVELVVTQRRQPKVTENATVDEDDEYQISAAAMARVARYTGASGPRPSASAGGTGAGARARPTRACSRCCRRRAERPPSTRRSPPLYITTTTRIYNYYKVTTIL